MLTKPFKGMTQAHISQVFHSEHRAWDIVGNQGLWGYGTPLCAPENLRVEWIIGDSFTPNSHKSLERGYGVWCTGLETDLVYVFWHTLPVLPINGGDIVKRGGIIAWMGNAGKVRSGGVDVPLEERTKEPFKGTHLHIQVFSKGHSIGQWSGGEVDLKDLMQWNWEPQYSMFDYLTAIGKTLSKATKIITK